MRLLVLFVLTLASMATLADDAQALGRRRCKKVNQCCAAPVVATPCCGAAVGGPVAMPAVVVPAQLPGK